MAGVLLSINPVVREAVVKRPRPESSFRNPCRYLCLKQGGLVAFGRRGKNVGDHEHGVPCLWHQPWHKRIDVIPSRLPGACCYGGEKRKNRPPLPSSRCVSTLARLNTKPRETNITVETLCSKATMGSTTQYHGTKSYLRFPLDMDLHTPISAIPVPQFPNTPPLPALRLHPNSISPYRPSHRQRWGNEAAYLV